MPLYQLRFLPRGEHPYVRAYERRLNAKKATQLRRLLRCESREDKRADKQREAHLTEWPYRFRIGFGRSVASGKLPSSSPDALAITKASATCFLPPFIASISISRAANVASRKAAE